MEVMNNADNELKHDSENSVVDLPLAQNEIIIEEITRDHKLLHRHKFCQEHVTIGRGYQNNIILTDPYICPHHFSITYEQGDFYLQDNNSINGTELENSDTKKQRVQHQKINDGDVIFIGKSQLRILFKNHNVAKTIPLSPFEPLIDVMRNPIAVFISIALFMFISGHITYLNQLSETNISQLFVGAFSKSLLFALWPAGVALVSHLTKNDPRIFTQLGISFTFFNLMWFSDLFADIIAFNTASNSFLTIITSTITILLAFSLFWLNGYIGFHTSARRRIVIAFSITTLLFGGSYLLQYSQKPDFDSQPRYSSSIMSPNYLIAPSNDVSTFIDDSTKLFELADKSVEKEKEKLEKAK